MKAIIALALAAIVAGCASYSGRGLVPGQSTADEVERLMGPSADQRPGPGGETVRYYSRMPYGRETFAARFGPDGKLKAIEQRLTPEYYAKVVPGTSRASDVRDLLGPPWRVDRFPRMEREIWTYATRGFTIEQQFLVQLSGDGMVREVYLIDDPEAVRTARDG